MRRGKIIKIRIGHEANCSSGMVALGMLMLGAITYLPLSLIAAVLQTATMPRVKSQRQKWIIYLIIPLALGLIITALLAYWASTRGYAREDLLGLALIMGLSFAVSVTGGYKLAPKIRYWNCLAVPIILLVVFVAFCLIGSWILYNLI